ncbi:hypothetical protein HJC23_009930 [Cyclotella cryptica]|uniref:Uncharacterized protein n=1 Tax=Cyclotella cryptica TaxID=29204 RepID=A0ABD3P1S1_9STRA|eukprot:CCRYP_018308-RA/>CCRYP_018308-RA protein AED:0.38 eAED:0.38 QI:0/-1/0/1/-1/1/1/0/407
MAIKGKITLTLGLSSGISNGAHFATALLRQPHDATQAFSPWQSRKRRSSFVPHEMESSGHVQRHPQGTMRSKIIPTFGHHRHHVFPQRKRTTKLPSSSSSSVSSPPKHTQRTKTPTTLSMSLIPVPINELTSILPTPARLAPTGDQYVTYLGRTPRERFNTLFEGFSIAFLGTMFAYFISFVIGQFLATLLGIVFLFWPILSPEFKAYQRNWELVGGRDLVDVWMDQEDDENSFFFRGIPSHKRGLYGAYYVTRIQDVCVVDDVMAPTEDEYDLDEFSGYTMDKDELESITGIPWKLRLRLLDDEERGMQVHCRLSEDYLDIQPGMSAVGVLLSTSKEFSELAAMSDFCVLDEEGPVTWVGDYPYLDKNKFLRTLDSNGVWDTIMSGYEDYGEEEEEEEALSYYDKR